MPKTESKSVVTSVDPRVRMKQIRSKVAQTVKENVRIDKMTFTKDDTARVMIALQDQLEASNQAHNRATKHVMAQKEVLQAVATMSSIVVNDSTNKILEAQEKIGLLTKQRDGLSDECQRLSDGWQESNGKNLELRMELSKRGAQLDSALHTLKTLFDQDEPVYSYEGEEVMVNTHG